MARSKQIGRPIRQLGEPKTPPGPVTTYRLPIEEVQEKYGRPGVLATKMPYTRTEQWPELGGANTRHFKFKADCCG